MFSVYVFIVLTQKQWKRIIPVGLFWVNMVLIWIINLIQKYSAKTEWTSNVFYVWFSCMYIVYPKTHLKKKRSQWIYKIHFKLLPTTYFYEKSESDQRKSMKIILKAHTTINLTTGFVYCQLLPDWWCLPRHDMGE